jgi:hypothetical protein
MPETDQEVFDHFSNLAGENFEIGLMAYAKYAQEKYDWATHKRLHDGYPPSDEETTRWITELTNSRLDGIYSGAIIQFGAAAEDYMRPRIEAERLAVPGRVEIAAQRVERATSFWRNVVPNVIVAVAASFVFSLIVLVSAAIYRGDPSIFALFKEPPAGATRP